MNKTLIIQQQNFFDKNGREYIEFTPVFTPDCTAKGELRFACWQAWKDEPETWEIAMSEARKNALNVLNNLFKDIKIKKVSTRLMDEFSETYKKLSK